MPSTLSSPRSWQLPAAAVFATMASAIGLSRLIHPGAWVATLLLISLVIALSGVGLRHLGVEVECHDLLPRQQIARCQPGPEPVCHELPEGGVGSLLKSFVRWIAMQDLDPLRLDLERDRDG